METKGFTFNGVAGRIRDLETKVGGAYYVALCWLAMTRNAGKSAKKTLETKVFGQDKPTSTFRNAWRIAEKAFPEGFHKGHRQSVDAMGIDDAVKFAMEALETHKVAVGATNMAMYEDRCKFASVEDVPVAAKELSDGETPTAAGTPAPDNENVDVIANIKTAIAELTLAQAMEMGEWLAAHINAVVAAQAQPKALAA